MPAVENSKNVVVLASGSGTLLQALLDAPDPKPFRVAAVGSDLTSCIALDRATRAGVPTFTCRVTDHPDRAAWNIALADAVAAHRPDLVVLAGFMKLLGPGFLGAFDNKVINAHPSLLPAFPGMHAPADALAHGVKLTGCTVFLVDTGVDAGPIVAQRAVMLSGSETAPEVEAHLAILGAELLAESLPAWVAGKLPAMPQPREGASLTRPLRREDGRLDPALMAHTLERQVRAYQPWPGSWTEWLGERLTVWRASVVEVGAQAAPGAILRQPDGPVFVAHDGGLRFDEVQPAGGRRMSGTDYLRGRRT